MTIETNADQATVVGFGEEWSYYDNSTADRAELQRIFDNYFSLFPWSRLPRDAAGFDFGCGSGRWATFVSPRVGALHCMDASTAALAVAQANLRDYPNCTFTICRSAKLDLPDNSMDFGYALGVLHHIPDPKVVLREFARVLKPGAPLQLYIYYAMDNRPWWFRSMWHASNVLRATISRTPFRVRLAITQAIAAILYYPLAKTSGWLEPLGLNVEGIPLSIYRHNSFYVMRNDALDRFGTRLERRYSAAQIAEMLNLAGFTDIQFSPNSPYWCVVAIAP